jgi:T5SS/PEP-CTERM-associated repeat protein
VGGSGSLWNSGSGLYVGYSGVGNTLSITTTSAVYSVQGYVGYNPGANSNAVVVDGAGSVWSNSSSFFYVGYYGNGNSLTITNGGAVYDTAGCLGWRSANNTATVTGPGSLWSGTMDIEIGISGGGNQLTITNGGLVVSPSGTIGGAPLPSNTNNAVVVTDPGSVWSNSAPVSVGDFGFGHTLTITNGGAVYDTWGYIGAFSGFSNGGSNNSVIVTGPGSVWDNSTNLYLAYYGWSNALVVSAGGTVRDAQGMVGIATNANYNAVTVAGAGSL